MKMKIVFPVVALVAALAASPVALAHGVIVGYKNHSGEYRNFPLIHAAAHGDIKEVRAQLASGADVNAEVELEDSRGDKYGEMALIAAAKLGHGEVVKILLGAGADVNAVKKYGTALMRAAGEGHVEVVEILLAAGADVNAASSGWTALMDAVYTYQDDESVKIFKILVVKILLGAGADVNAKTNYGYTALMEAAIGSGGSNQGKIVKILLAAGADVNAATDDGYTALTNGIWNGEVVKILLAAGADVNAKSKESGRTGGRTALDMAKGKPTEQIIRNYSPGQYAHLLAVIEAYKRELEIDFNLNGY